MKDVIVLYKSHYGSTRQYAKWISDTLKCDIVSLDDFDFRRLDDYSTVIYGGGLYAVGMLGIKTLKKHRDTLEGKRLILFAVGLSSANQASMEAIRKANIEEGFEEVPFFYFRGRMDVEKLKFKHRVMMTMLAKKVKNKKSALSEDEKGILSCMEKPVDMVDRCSIDPLIDHLEKEGVS